jgi:valyl-tRNA synthetase
MAAPGTDIAFGEKRIEASRNFANKIWNASRFLFMNIDRAQETGWSLGEFWSGSKGDQGKASGVAGFQAEKLEDRWILSRLNDAAARVNDALQTYRFHEAAQVVYHFFWDEFCAWYIELVKLRMTFEEDSAESSRVALENAVLALEASLRLLSPFMPFLTEEIWHAVYDGKPPLKSVSLAPYPLADRAQIDRVAESEMTLLQDLIENIRNLRAELKVEQRLRTPVRIFADAEVRKLVEQNREAIERLANVESVEFASGHLSQAAGMRSTARFDVAVVYKKQIDVEAERDRLNKELEKITRELERARAQLANDSFRSKAPPQVVQGLEARAGELGVLRDKAERALKELGN